MCRPQPQALEVFALRGVAKNRKRPVERVGPVRFGAIAPAATEERGNELLQQELAPGEGALGGFDEG